MAKKKHKKDPGKKQKSSEVVPTTTAGCRGSSILLPGQH
ncbi:hypothetical protein HaLaN_10643, partial [Haematococcus lacustris]